MGLGAVCPLAAHHGAESCLLGHAVTAIASIAGMMLRCGNEVKGHVWTAPAVQEESDFLRSVRVQPCIRPLNAAVWLLALM
jgi:hypothetical protein